MLEGDPSGTEYVFKSQISYHEVPGFWDAIRANRSLIDNAEIQIENFLIEPISNTVDLDPNELIPTQRVVDLQNIQDMDGAEDLPPILVLRYLSNLYITDGHHRATRAALKKTLVAAVVVDL